MPSLRTIQNRLHRIKTEIMDIEESIKEAERVGKPAFAARLRLMIEEKLKSISNLREED